jgi:hypothetical protein
MQIGRYENNIYENIQIGKQEDRQIGKETDRQTGG